MPFFIRKATKKYFFVALSIRGWGGGEGLAIKKKKMKLYLCYFEEKKVPLITKLKGGGMP